MSFMRKQKDGYALLKIQGPMTINEATALHSEMVACFDEHDGLILDLNEVNECDTAGIQLLCSAKLTAKSTGKSFDITSTSLSSMSILERTGFDPDAVLGATH